MGMCPVCSCRICSHSAGILRLSAFCPTSEIYLLSIRSITLIIAMQTRKIRRHIHVGDSTQIHDQSMTWHSFRTMNTIVNTVPTGNPPTLFDSLLMFISKFTSRSSHLSRYCSSLFRSTDNHIHNRSNYNPSALENTLPFRQQKRTRSTSIQIFYSDQALCLVR